MKDKTMTNEFSDRKYLFTVVDYHDCHDNKYKKNSIDIEKKKTPLYLIPGHLQIK